MQIWLHVNVVLVSFFDHQESQAIRSQADCQYNTKEILSPKMAEILSGSGQQKALYDDSQTLIFCYMLFLHSATIHLQNLPRTS